MSFWLREIAGWLLVSLGLLAFYICYHDMLRTGHYVDGAELAIIGIFIFRGGINLLRVAIAARICMQAEHRRAAGPPVPSRGLPRP
jgi:hypothetical protein